jgi:primary-amine oxidase
MNLRFMAPLADITMDLFDGVCRGLPNDTLVSGASPPMSFDGSWRRYAVFSIHV